MINKDKEALGYYESAVDAVKLLGYTDEFLAKVKQTYSTSKFDETLLLDNIDLSKMPSNFDIVNEINSLITSHEHIQENLEAKIQYVEEEVAENLHKALTISIHSILSSVTL